jgi:hypothetical protein
MTDRVDKDSLPLNQPRRTPNHPTKSHIVKTKVDGKEKIIRFGEQGASTAGKPKEGESDRMKAKRASFKSRHAKNIAKGPSSPAYWANKVKWADGGFVKTNYYDGGSMRAQPQNAALGRIADFLKQTYSPQRTQQMQGTMEFLGVPALARTAERLSYGQPITNVNKANVPLLPDDTAEAAMLVAPPLTSLAKRVGTNLVQTAPYVARDIVQNVTSPLKSYAVKPKGGNWAPTLGSRDSVKMSVYPLKRNPEVISGDLINQAAGEDLWSKMIDEGVYQYPVPWLRENRPDVLNKLVGEERGAVNKWLDSKLEKYIRNEMGTPDDPIRLAHEEGYSHIPGNAAEELGAWLPEETATMRRKAGYPEEGFAAKKHADAGYPEDMEANTRKAELWENLADTEITSSPAGAYQEQFRMAREKPSMEGAKGAVQRAERNPWIEKLDPETLIYKIDNTMDLNENLGFGHMADEIQNMLDPESGLPAALRLTPQQLDKLSVKQMVEKVDAVNKWRAKSASDAELEDMMGNLTATPKLEIPDAQLSFVKEPGMKWIDIPATVDDSAMKLCTTLGRQAGWCTQGEGLAKRYGSGENSLTTLIDAEGRPHAQAMITKSKNKGLELGDVLDEEDAIADQIYRNAGQILSDRGFGDAEDLAMTLGAGAESELPKAARDILNSVYEQAERMLPKRGVTPLDITELKPVENAFSSERAREYTKRDPAYKEKITESVLKFLNAGEWGAVKDLHHYDIVDLRNPSGVQKALADVLDYDLPHERMDKFNYATNFNPDAPRFMSESQFRAFVNPDAGKQGYKEGGSVDADEQAAFGIYPNAGKRSQKSDIGDKLNASLMPQDAVDLASMLLPFGKVGKTLAAAVISGAPAEAQAGNITSLMKLVAREAPAQAKTIREALGRAFSKDIEHSVVGSSDRGPAGTIMSGDWDSVNPNQLDILRAVKGDRPIVDFHTHPRAAQAAFDVAPSEGDFRFAANEYFPGKQNRELRTIIASPANLAERVPTSYSFFATDNPSKVFDRRALNSAVYELQRAGSKGTFKSVMDDPRFRQYFEAGGTMGDLAENLAPLAMLDLRKAQGLGRGELQLSGRNIAPQVSNKDVYKAMNPLAVEFLTRKGFAEGGSVSYDPNQVDEIINSISAPRNYAEGGSVTAYDPSRVDAILNQFM